MACSRAAIRLDGDALLRRGDLTHGGGHGQTGARAGSGFLFALDEGRRPPRSGRSVDGQEGRLVAPGRPSVPPPGLGVEASAHQLRHRFATKFYEESGP
jgi:hypothetical protein